MHRGFFLSVLLFVNKIQLNNSIKGFFFRCTLRTEKTTDFAQTVIIDQSVGLFFFDDKAKFPQNLFSLHGKSKYVSWWFLVSLSFTPQESCLFDLWGFFLGGGGGGRQRRQHLTPAAEAA